MACGGPTRGTCSEWGACACAPGYQGTACEEEVPCPEACNANLGNLSHGTAATLPPSPGRFGAGASQPLPSKNAGSVRASLWTSGTGASQPSPRPMRLWSFASLQRAEKPTPCKTIAMKKRLAGRSRQKLPPQRQWNPEALEKVGVLPADEHRKQPTDVEVTFEAEPRPAPDTAEFRSRWRIFRQDLDEHGFTVGCPQCDREREPRRKVFRVSRNHSKVCRNRIGEALGRTDEGRLRLERYAAIESAKLSAAPTKAD